MLRRLLVLGLVVTLVSTLAAVAAIQTSSDEAEAQVTSYEMSYLCRDYYTGFYKGSFSGSCPPGHQLLTLPEDYPVSLCVGAYDGFLRAPNYSGQCPPATSLRIELPSETQVNICYIWATGRLRLPTPYGSTNCGAGGFLVTFPIDVQDDTYQTLGNVDIDVPASDGLLSNDTGPGLTVTAFDATSVNGGTVNVNPDGSFTYIPPIPDPNAFTGDDSFTYTVESSSGQSEVVTVTIQVLNPVVWFVDADAADPGDGRRLTPLNDISVLNDNGNDPDDPGDFIFLYEASATYDDQFDLETDQYLVGQEVDLEEILQQAIEGTTLLGLDASELPPFIVTPEANPSGDVPVLQFLDFALLMDEDSTAVGLTIASEYSTAVLVEDVDGTTLDRVTVFGGTDGDGFSGIDVIYGGLTILDSEIYGGNGAESIDDISSTQLLGDVEGGDGGEAIFTIGSNLTITGSLVQGGDGGGIGEIASGTTLQGGDVDYGGHGGAGILNPQFSGITINGASTIYGGNGSFGYYEGGAGGDGIGDLSRTPFSDAGSRELQGPPTELIPFIDVSGASIVEGGDGGDSEEWGGFGGAGIASQITIVTLTENSRASGGNGGSGYDEGGGGGEGIIVGATTLLSGAPAIGSSLQGILEDEIALLTVDSSTVEGGDGASGANYIGGWGGDGIVVGFFADITGTSQSELQGDIPGTLTFNVTNSTVTAGNGGASDGGEGGDDAPATVAAFPAVGGASDGGEGGDGGWGIWLFIAVETCCFNGTSLQGPGGPGFDFDLDLNVTGSDVYGGVGGDGEYYGGYGGVGIANGFPFFYGPLADESNGRQLQLIDEDVLIGGDLTVVDSTVEGGAAGNSYEEEAGMGGPAIVSVGESPLSGLLGGIGTELSATISSSQLLGGTGGDSAYYDGGYGGDAIAIFGMDLVVDQGTTATGGNGGSGEYFGGSGGFGIFAEEATILVDASTMTAGFGGQSIEDEGGLGGEGIYGYLVDLTVQNNSVVTGGAGGPSDFSDGGIGGDGIYTEDSVVTFANSTATAGAGGSSIEDDGGRGGHGVHVDTCEFCNTLTVTTSTIFGGDGGSSTNVNGGTGGEGVIIENDNATVTGSTITGGNGGAGSLTGADGDGAPAVELEFDDAGDYAISILTNSLTAGSGETGTAPSLAVLQEGTGSVCVDATGNTPTGDFVLTQISGTLGITQASIGDMSAANNGVPVNGAGTITFNCVVIQN